MHNIWFALWFFAPAGAANVTPVFLAKMPGLRHLNAPVDGGRSWHGHRLLGNHKTWRGLLSGILAGILAIWLQSELFRHTTWGHSILQQLNYAALPIFTLGFLLGFGALLGDMIESFIKRQINVAPGHSWFPFDQLDYIIGGLLLSALVVRLTAWQYIWVFILWFGIHLITSYIGFYVHLKSSRI